MLSLKLSLLLSFQSVFNYHVLPHGLSVKLSSKLHQFCWFRAVFLKSIKNNRTKWEFYTVNINVSLGFTFFKLVFEWRFSSSFEHDHSITNDWAMKKKLNVENEFPANGNLLIFIMVSLLCLMVASVSFMLSACAVFLTDFPTRTVF